MLQNWLGGPYPNLLHLPTTTDTLLFITKKEGGRCSKSCLYKLQGCNQFFLKLFQEWPILSGIAYWSKCYKVVKNFLKIIPSLYFSPSLSQSPSISIFNLSLSISLSVSIFNLSLSSIFLSVSLYNLYLSISMSVSIFNLSLSSISLSVSLYNLSLSISLLVSFFLFLLPSGALHLPFPHNSLPP